MGGYTIVYALINFAILAGVLFLAGRKTAARTFGGRRDKLAEELAAAREAQSQAETLRQSREPALAKGEQECREILAAAEAAVQAEQQDQAAEDERVLGQIADRSRRDLGQLSRAQQTALSREASRQILEQAEKQLQRPENASGLEKLTPRLIRVLEEKLTVGPGDLTVFRDGGSIPLVLCSAAALTAGERQRILDAVLRALAAAGADAGVEQLRLSESVDERLLGGLRLQLGDTVYDGSLAALLARTGRALDAVSGKEDLLAAWREELERAGREPEVYQSGTVISVSDGICRVSGVSDAMAGEMIAFDSGVRGMVMDLEKNNVGVVMLGSYERVQEGQKVRRTGQIIQVPVGEELIGRVVNALGEPIDGAGPLQTRQTRAVESPAPGVIQRQSVSVPMQTGIKAIDALIPIGRGQRELIIGDRQTGKTAIALDAIINQKGKDMICIYVAVGKKESTVAGFVEKLRQHGAMDYSIVVCASASESAPMLYIAPYAGAAIGEYFMYKGKDVLIIYDDLSQQAVAYREISLLLHRPPGREAYPGDVFYLHSRLLERAARLSDELGGGSMTALPIIETQAGDISAYIPTNVISITDGQIFLETDLFNAGVRPAVNVGLSVSRVGGSAQLGAMKQVAGRLRMDLAQYRELSAFAQFGADLDKTTQATLRRGDRMTELLKQEQYKPMEASDQVIAIFAVNEGFADQVELKDMGRFEEELLRYVRERYPQLRARILSGEKLEDKELKRLRRLIGAFSESFS